MFGLDEWIANVSDGTSLLLVVGVATLLGLRHATDPDHLAAVSTLVTSTRGARGRASAELGMAWGAGHATTLFVFGLPIVVFEAFLPDRVQMAAETLVGVLIIGLSLWLLVRWRRGFFATQALAAADAPRTRTPFQAFGIGLLHGTGGSAGVGILIIGTVDNKLHGVVALALLALFTAVSMTALTAGLGSTLGTTRVQRSFNRFAPGMAVASLAFGIWYALGAMELSPYYF